MINHYSIIFEVFMSKVQLSAISVDILKKIYGEDFDEEKLEAKFDELDQLEIYYGNHASLPTRLISTAPNPPPCC